MTTEIAHTSLFLSFLALIGPAAVAQTTHYETIPSGMFQEHGNYYSRGFGSLATGRMQFGNAGWVGQGRKVLTRMYLRHTKNVSYLPSRGMGRKWQTLRVTMFENDMTGWNAREWAPDTRPGPLNTRIPVSKTEVFRNRWSLPTVSSWGTHPNPRWGSPAQIPFTQPYTYLGKESLIMDFRFEGGRLDNAATWSGATEIPYYLDGAKDAATQVATNVGAILGGSPACGDSALTGNATTTASISVYGGAYATVGLRGMEQLNITSRVTAPRALVIHAMSLGGSRSGVALGAACNRLHVDPGAIFLLLPRTASFSGAATTALQFPFQSHWAGQTCVAQSAWADSATNRFSLTTGSEVRVPSQPLSMPDRRAVWGHLVGNLLPMTYVTQKHSDQLLPMFAWQ